MIAYEPQKGFRGDEKLLTGDVGPVGGGDGADRGGHRCLVDLVLLYVVELILGAGELLHGLAYTLQAL